MAAKNDPNAKYDDIDVFTLEVRKHRVRNKIEYDAFLDAGVFDGTLPPDPVAYYAERELTGLEHFVWWRMVLGSRCIEKAPDGTVPETQPPSVSEPPRAEPEPKAEPKPIVVETIPPPSPPAPAPAPKAKQEPPVVQAKPKPERQVVRRKPPPKAEPAPEPDPPQDPFPQRVGTPEPLPKRAKRTPSDQLSPEARRNRGQWDAIVGDWEKD